MPPAREQRDPSSIRCRIEPKCVGTKVATLISSPLKNKHGSKFAKEKRTKSAENYFNYYLQARTKIKRVLQAHERQTIKEALDSAPLIKLLWIIISNGPLEFKANYSLSTKVTCSPRSLHNIFQKWDWLTGKSFSSAKYCYGSWALQQRDPKKERTPPSAAITGPTMPTVTPDPHRGHQPTDDGPLTHVGGGFGL